MAVVTSRYSPKNLNGHLIPLSQRAHPVFDYLVPLLFVTLWSTGFIGAKYGLPAAEPFTFLLIRMLITIVILGLLIPLFNVSWPHRARDYLHLGIVGILIHGMYLGGVFSAIYRGVDSGLSAVIVGLQPLVTVLLSSLWLGEHLGRIVGDIDRNDLSEATLYPRRFITRRLYSIHRDRYFSDDSVFHSGISRGRVDPAIRFGIGLACAGVVDRRSALTHVDHQAWRSW